MNETHCRAIIFLLAAILSVMLFGASAFLTGLAWLAGIGAVLGIVFLVIAGVAKFLGSIREEVVAARAERKPWIWLLVAWPGIVGGFVICGLAAVRWMGGGIRYGDAISTVPYSWVPVTLILAGMAVAAIESAHEWLPKVPGRVAALLRGWLMLLGAPVLAPFGRWQSIREQRARGEVVGVVSAGLSILGTFLASLLVWIAAVSVPLTLVLIIAQSLRLS